MLWSRKFCRIAIDPLRKATQSANRGTAPARRRPEGRSRFRPLSWLPLALAGEALPVGLLADHRTAIGERRTIALQDGSEVELGAATAINVSFSTNERRIKLLAGEAFFTVAKDPSRPLIVAAGNGEVKVLGTSFDVKVADVITVAVASSAVEVSNATSPPVKVAAGQAIHYDKHKISAVTAADLETIRKHGDRSSWCSGTCRLITCSQNLRGIVAARSCCSTSRWASGMSLPSLRPGTATPRSIASPGRCRCGFTGRR